MNSSDQVEATKKNSIVYLPLNLEEFQAQALSLIDSTSHLEAKRSMSWMVCISGQKKQSQEREREMEREKSEKEKKRERTAKGIGTSCNYIIA